MIALGTDRGTGMMDNAMMGQSGAMMLFWTTGAPARPGRELTGSAVQLLERRLASGEIDDEEHLRRRSALDSR